MGLYSPYYNLALSFPSFVLVLLILVGVIGGAKTNLRTLFLVSTLFAVNLGLLRWRYEPVLRLERIRHDVAQLSGLVRFTGFESHWPRFRGGEYHLRFRGDRRQFDDQRVGRMLDTFGGVRLTVAYLHRGPISDAVCDRLAEARSLRVVTLHDTEITPSGAPRSFLPATRSSSSVSPNPN